LDSLGYQLRLRLILPELFKDVKQRAMIILLKIDKHYNYRMEIKQIITSLKQQDIKYAFYFKRRGQDAVLESNYDRFSSASIIKLPLLLTWVHLERQGVVDRAELCDLDAEPQVRGAGFAYQMLARRLPYRDVLLMMIALSDNLCTNLVIRRIGLERVQQVFRSVLGMQGTELQRKLMDYKARDQGLDNWVSAADAVRLFDLFDGLAPEEKAWVEPMLLVNTDDLLLKRNVPRDQLDFYHKTGSIQGVFHDWGYTRDCKIFLFTNQVKDVRPIYDIFGMAGELLIE